MKKIQQILIKKCKLFIYLSILNHPKIPYIYIYIYFIRGGSETKLKPPQKNPDSQQKYQPNPTLDPKKPTQMSYQGPRAQTTCPICFHYQPPFLLHPPQSCTINPTGNYLVAPKKTTSIPYNSYRAIPQCPSKIVTTKNSRQTGTLQGSLSFFSSVIGYKVMVRKIQAQKH